VVALFLLAVVTRAGAQTYDSLSYLAHEVDSVKHFEQWTQRLVHLCVPDGGLLELKLVRARMAPPKEDLFVIGATYRAPPEAVPPATAGHLIVLVDGASATLATPFGPASHDYGYTATRAEVERLARGTAIRVVVPGVPGRCDFPLSSLDQAAVRTWLRQHWVTSPGWVR